MEIISPKKTLATDLVALVLSLFLHAALVGVLSFVNLAAPPPVDQKEPVFVDIIDLPPAPGKTEEPEKPTVFSHRSQKVEKEKTAIPGKILSKPVEKDEGGAKAKALKPVKEAPQEEPDRAEGRDERADLPPVAEVPGEESVAMEARPEASKEDLSGTVPGKAQPEVEPSAPATEEPAKPKLFPSDERLMELAKKYYEEEPEREKGKVLTLNTSELKYSKYLLNLKRRIEFFWDYPTTSARKGEHGRLKINFTITGDGDLESIDVVKSSNYPSLDDAAVTAIRLASPFNPFPEDFAIEKIDIHARFEYIIIYYGDRLR